MLWENTHIIVVSVDYSASYNLELYDLARMCDFIVNITCIYYHCNVNQYSKHTAQVHAISQSPHTCTYTMYIILPGNSA